MEREIQRLGLPIRRMPAVDGSALTDAEYTQLHPHWDMHRLSKPELACFLSHRACWKVIAAAPNAFGAVFEDDLAFSDDMARFLSDDAWLPANCDLIKIESTYRRVALSQALTHPNGRRLARLHSRHLGAGGYVISRQYAQELLVATELVTLPVDYALFDPARRVIGERPVYQIAPALCVQQLRARDVFLPQGISWSELDTARATLKAKGTAKILRELTRPFRTLGGFLHAKAQAAAKGQTWEIIAFRR